MKRNIALSLILLLAVGAVLYALAAEDKAKDVTVTGEVIDSFCYIKSGAKSSAHGDCATACAKAGVPLAILEDKTDKVWWVSSDKDAESGNAKLMPYVAKKVTISGKVYERGGAKILAISSVKPA